MVVDGAGLQVFSVQVAADALHVRLAQLGPVPVVLVVAAGELKGIAGVIGAVAAAVIGVEADGVAHAGPDGKEPVARVAAHLHLRAGDVRLET